MAVQYILPAVLIGFVLDLILGDPPSFVHPVRLIGKSITALEKLLRGLFPRTDRGERLAGLCLVLLVVGYSAILPVILLELIYRWNNWAGLLVEAFLCYQLLATKSLKVESMKVYRQLKKGSLKGARKAVSMIVGRDTERLTEEGVAKAAVETVAENTSDGVIAPLFYMMIGGAAAAMAYKAVNTMDSMIGYKNEKYRYFGTCAARLDDILNFIPARIAALLMIVAAGVLKLDGAGAWKIFCRDRKKHASPNSAQTESVMAGALGVQLAGDAWYFGELHHKKTIGDPGRRVIPEDIVEANRLLYGTALLALVVFALLRALVLLIIAI
ncbi:MAG TPA: cobalamin biosynthesis protein CobD [Candidatus Egerieimonas intestinavium]|uniref:Cobalamin biosynthesis protein CobD n=1 Tax=Candidatus Egerieimonas intestinavium TaxID=2840777 RepID=A0A9D1EKS6_9FIRM|nr:cobalamin biosynthesis protein CobD [Candidatus Egerieimonas intestinavium]